jgi:hypothetical protein
VDRRMLEARAEMAAQKVVKERRDLVASDVRAQ